MTTSKTTPPKTNAIGSLLLVALTAGATALAIRHKDKLGSVWAGFAQMMADGRAAATARA